MRVTAKRASVTGQILGACSFLSILKILAFTGTAFAGDTPFNMNLI